jgi:hypothetical protein
MINLKELSIPQLRAIKSILVNGVVATAEETAAKTYSCHKSPPKGYPKDKDKYGDSECFRYPLDTKSRCLAAWRYVNQKSNSAILGDKASAVKSKIKNFAKDHYSLDLQEGTSEDWEQSFSEYYDSETMGERCDTVVLSSDEDDVEALKASLQSKDTELGNLRTTIQDKDKTIQDKDLQVASLVAELTTLKEDHKTLKEFKETAEKVQERTNRLTAIKSKLGEAELSIDIEAEADTWLGMSDSVLDFTIAKMCELRKGVATAGGLRIPNLTATPTDNIGIVREGFKELKGKKIGKR